MARRDFILAAGLALLQLTSWNILAQQVQKPLTNADVIKLVEAGVPESVIVSTIRSSPPEYDLSPDGLVSLHKGGATQQEMDAMIAASAASSPSTKPAAQSQNAANSPANPNLPAVALMQTGVSQPLPAEKTQVAQTKTKPTSMASLAGDSALSHAIQGGVSTAAWDAAVHTHSGVGSMSEMETGNVVAGLMARRRSSVTYVWGVPNASSSNLVHTFSPEFSVNFAHTPGVNSDDFEPAIIKLTPSQNSCRIVGATQGKEDARSSSAADWEVYSSFLEERVVVASKKNQPGDYVLSPATALSPGEYAVVLRPVSKSLKFSGGDVARAQGNGLMFDSVWSFQVQPDAK